MLRTILGALVGRELERRRADGGSGVRGALVGVVMTRAVTRMGPVGMALGGAYVAKKAYDRRRAAKAGRVPPAA